MSSKPIPIVAIVGRANVGKSSLFNAIVGRREAIVAKEPGTTRDNVMAKASWADKDFWLVDTAGLKTAEDDFELGIQQQVAQAAQSAAAIIVVVDSSVRFTAEDRKVATVVLKSGKPSLLAANKIDKNPKADTSELLRLGIRPVVVTSASQKKGIEQLLDGASSLIPARRLAEDQNKLKVAILGRPNAGKSSLFNSLAMKQQALVSAHSGTTRDVNRVVLRYKGKQIEFMDTAGIRRPGRIERGVEQFSVLRSLAAIEESDIAILVIDSQETAVQLDQKIAGLVKEAGRGLILAISKWDMMAEIDSPRDRSSLSAELAEHFNFTPWASLVFTSAVTGENVSKIFDLVLQIADNRAQRFKTPELNRWLQTSQERHPPAGLKGRLPQLNYIVQEQDIDYPSFKIFGSETKFLHWSYKRYLERKFRERWPLPGTPIKFWFINKR